MKNRFTFFTLRLLAVFSFLLVFAETTRAQTMETPQPSNIFTGKDAGGIIASAIVKDGAGNDVRVTINEARDEDIIANAQGIISANADSLEVDKSRSRWQAILLLKADGHNLAPMKLSGRFDELTSIPVLKRRIQPGEVIGENDIDWDKQPISHMRKNTVTDVHELIGKSPKHMISEERPIRVDEIASPMIVNKGEQVTLYFRSHNIEIKTFGEAMEPGARGDVIRVRNQTSKAVIQGVVESADSVRVSSPDTNAAEAM